MDYKEIAEKVAEELSLDKDTVVKVYMEYWKGIGDSIREHDLETCREEEFDDIRTSYNLPYLGKFACTKDRWKRIRNKLIKYKENGGIKDN